jgi:predicted Zn finger-like uncharacterized protein
MAIEFACPHCQTALRVNDAAAGRTVRCPRCSTTTRAPAVTPEPDIPYAVPVSEPGIPPPPVRSPAIPVAPPKVGVHGRPRRDTDQPRQGRGPLFWILAVLLVVGFVVVAGCGGLLVSLGNPRWRTHESAEGGFRVELPAAPRGDIARLARANPDPNVRAEGTILWGRFEEFAVCYADRPAGPAAQDDEAVLKEIIDQVPQTMPGARVVRHEPIVVSGCPGVEAVVEGGGVRSCLLRAVLAGPRLYVVIAGGRFADRDNPRVRRFVESFEVTDPNLRALARERRQAPWRAGAERAGAERVAAEARLIAEDRMWAEAEAIERAYQDSLQNARNAFRDEGVPGRSPPDPALIPGLVYYLGFDGPDPLRSKYGGVSSYPSAAVRGTGALGSGYYMPAHGNLDLTDLGTELRAALSRPMTLACWVKLRYRPVTLFRFDGRGHLTVGGTQVVLDVASDRNDATSHPVAAGGTVVAGDWTLDDKWHHVAAVREVRDGQVWSVIYLDGKRLAEGATGPGFAWGTTRRVILAQAGSPVAPAWPGPIGPPDRSGKPQYAPNDEMAFGIDELCVYDRPLSNAEIRVLAGVDPVPADLAKPTGPPKIPPVALAAGPQLPAFAGFAFDPDRQTAWAVTAVTAGRRELVRYSYPELKEVARYPLLSTPGPIAFDPDTNRLFVASQFTGSYNPMRPGEPVGGGWAVCRYDLDDLPNASEFARPTVQGVPEPGEITALVLTPDGKWVYGVAARGVTGVSNNAGVVFRLPAGLRVTPGSAGLGRFAVEGGHRLEYVAVGPAVWVAVRQKSGADGEWYRFDPATGKQLDSRSFSTGLSELVDWVVHPAGDRLFTLSANGTVAERVPGKNGTFGVRAILGDPNAPNRQDNLAAKAGRLGITPDGRFLFRAAGGTLTVADTTARAPAGSGVTPSAELAIGPAAGPFWVSPDATVLVFRSGQVVRVSYPEGLAPKPARPPKSVAARSPRPALAPAPREWISPEVLARTAPAPRLKLTMPAVTRAPTAYSGGPIPAASEFGGLKFYLDFEERDGGRVKDSVSGASVGRLYRAEPVDGVRGKGLRLACDVKASFEPGFDLSDAAASLRIPAGRPFTLSVWVRFVQGSTYAFHASGNFRPGDKIAAGYFSVWSQTGKTESIAVQMVGHDDPEPKAGKPTLFGYSRSQDGGRWHHLAVVRDEKNVVRFLVDGEVTPQPAGGVPARQGSSFWYDRIRFGWPHANQAGVVDIDEFCLFDRALTDDELKRLGGRAK